MKNLATNFLGISSVLLFTGILFKTNHWPGASICIFFGVLGSILGMLFYFIARHKNKNDVKVATYAVYFYFFVMVVGTGYYSAIAPSKDLLNGFHDVNVQMEKSNESLKSMLSDKSQSRGMKLYNIIETHKLNLITNGNAYSDLSKEIVKDEFCDQHGIPLSKDNQDVAAHYFLVSDGGEYGSALEFSLKELRVLYSAKLGKDYPNLIEDVEKQKFEYGFPIPWINSLCENLPMIAVLPKLSAIQNQILHCELAMQK
jgi:hypothetical protein